MLYKSSCFGKLLFEFSDYSKIQWFCWTGPLEDEPDGQTGESRSSRDIFLGTVRRC